MRQWESNPTNPKLYRDFNEFVQIKRYGATAMKEAAQPYNKPDYRQKYNQEYNARSGILPPVEYDRPYKGVLLEIRGDKEKMGKLCPKTAFPITLGCAYVHATDCTIVIADDDIIAAQGWTYDL